MTLEFFPNCGCGTKIWKCQNVMKHPDMQKFLTYEHSLLTILGPKVLAEPNLAAILTQLHLLPRTQIFTEASYFVLVYLCLIWCWYLEWCRSHRASKLAFCSILGLINLWKPFLPTSDQNTMGYLWQNWPPQWVVSRSGVILVVGTFTFVQIWCQNFCGQNFFLANQKFWRGVLLRFSKNDLGIFSQLWVWYQNMKTSECHETSRYEKIFDLQAFFVDRFGPQSSG